MNAVRLIQEIADKNFDVDWFVKLSNGNNQIRDEIVYHMTTNPDIMVYYHCYYFLSKASQEQPESYYPYWDEIADLLNHSNSYHRDSALTIIGNLSKVDKHNKFADIEGRYFELINDPKFMTGNCCVQNCLKIYQHKTELRETIIELLLDLDKRCGYSDKQIGVLKCDVLEIFDEIYEQEQNKDRIHAFIKAEVNCINPKTRKKAGELVRKYKL